MTEVKISAVESRRDLDAFIKFPWRIYQDDPAWVPPLILERRAFLDRKRHPFYQHGDAALFMARRDEELVGRIMASDDRNYNALHGTSTGCFGMFESVNDVEVARALFDAARQWLIARGRNELIGPIDYSTNYVCGLVIDGFEHPPTLLTPHNPPYYQQLFERCGLTKEVDWIAWWFDDRDKPLQRLRRIARGRGQRRAFTVRQFNLKDLAGESQRLRAVFNEAWKNNWGFVPFTDAEADHMAREMKPILDPRYTYIAEADGQPIALLICVPDINVAIKELNGRLLPFGWLKLLRARSRIKTMRVVALGVVDAFRGVGVAEALLLKLIEQGSKDGRTGELSMTLETNHQVNRLIEAMGAKPYKRYRMYRQSMLT